MPDFRFVHAGDLHLDTPFDGLSRLGGDLPARLRDASLTAFDNLVAETLRVEADALVLAGDLYDGPERGLRAQLRLRDGFARLTQAGVQVFLVHGNHDPVEEGWSAVAWPEGVHVFPTQEVEGVPVHRSGREIARVYGISYARRDTTDNLAARFPQTSDAPFAVGLLHANVGNNPAHARYAPCELSELTRGGMDYWALGHVHDAQVLSDGAVHAVYSGVLQGRSPKPSEQGPKGAYLVDVDDGRVSALSFRPLDVVRFETLQVDVEAVADTGGLQDALQTAAADAAEAADGRDLILRADLTGRGAVHQQLRRGAGVEEVLQSLQEAGTQVAGARVWWDRLIDRTAPPLDKDAIRRRGDFSAELLLRAEALLADPEQLDAFLAAHARPTDRRLRALVDAADAETDQATLAAALDEALDRLEPEE
ncbi:metallophosphoesterase family protein [Rhodovibrio salinarum]|uniref:DNA repair exonuclease n=1 Tax=Rhodovibrio salinarum TaxID=1087 RepID=A0A934QLG5_9PROT|nr:DNA repair exonuclease [Rhodovibrio salinarum]MBK1698780.1 DNA repair exonuclease [Rhodovibrio salinarum]